MMELRQLAFLFAVTILVSCGIFASIFFSNKNALNHSKRQAFTQQQRALIISMLMVMVSVLLGVWGLKSDSDEHVQFWLQTFTGNWSPERGDNAGPELFSLSVLIALAINLSALYFLLQIFRGVRDVQRRQTVKLTQLFLMRDRVLKEALYDALIKDRISRKSDLGGLAALVEGAFKKGNEAWTKEYLAIAFTPGEIENIEHLMEDEEKEDLRRALSQVAEASPG